MSKRVCAMRRPLLLRCRCNCLSFAPATPVRSSPPSLRSPAGPVGAWLIQNDPSLSDQQSDQIIALAARHRMPAGFERRKNAEAGGLMSYGADRAAVYRQVGPYAGRILKGDKPADLPVQQPTKFELI